MSGTDILESCLHTSLVEHINAEIALGTIQDIASAISWLKSTFLYIRIRSNPLYYQLDGKELSIEKRLESLCFQDLRLLAQKQMIITDEAKIRVAPYGNAMAKYYVRFQSMIHILDIPRNAKMRDIVRLRLLWLSWLTTKLIALCRAEEFSDLRFRAGEKGLYNDIKKLDGFKFTYTEKTDEIWQKVFLLAQIDICGVDLTGLKDKHKSSLVNLNMHKHMIRQHLVRLLSCTVDCNLNASDSSTVQAALELRRSLIARCWANTPGSSLCANAHFFDHFRSTQAT